jgi:hypothetical protein
LDYLIGHSDPLVSLPRFEPASEFDPISYPKERAEDCWTSALEGRRIAVIHPMTDSIRLQSAKLKQMHKKTRLDFQVTGIISPPLTNGLRVAGLPFGAQLGLFEKNVSRFIEQSRPDIVLVAAGAYGAPIAHHIFSLGVTAFQMGGSLQLLFGIMGNRWRNSVLVQNQVTEHWLSKPLEARPTGSILIEGSTYW